jgi:hypothetical protein
MKQLNEQFRRMQQLAGLITEIKVATPLEFVKTQLKDAIKAKFPRKRKIGTDEHYDLLALTIKLMYGIDIENPRDTFEKNIEKTPYWEKIQNHDYVSILYSILHELGIRRY